MNTPQFAPCVRSGFCCKKAPCPFGEGTPCIYLGGDKPGNYYCEKHDEITKDPTSHISPAFGGGCSSTLFNLDRNTLLTNQKP